MATKASTQTKRKRGRPSDYKPEYAEEAEKLYMTGKTDEQVAEYFKVSDSTLRRWVKDNKEFRQARKRGRDADMNVERSLYERAMGYSHPEEKIFCSDGEVTRVQTMRHYPPDPTAMIFWLKNRRPEQWRDKMQADLSGNVQVTIKKYTDGAPDQSTE